MAAAEPARRRASREPGYLVYRAGIAVASALPEPLLFPAARAAGTVLARVNRRRRAVVRDNLALVTAPDRLEPTVDEAFRSYARYWMEALRTPKPGIDAIRARTTVEGIDAVAHWIARGRGVLFVSGHIGSWDTAGAWLASHGWRVVSIAEQVEPPALYDLFVRLRRRVGVEIHPLGKASSAKAVLDALRNGAVVGLVVDRDISGTGIPVRFLGRTALVPAGPATLALRTGAVVAAGALYQVPGGRWHGVVLDPIEVERTRPDDAAVAKLTQRIACDVERLIRRDPGQWHMFQPLDVAGTG